MPCYSPLKGCLDILQNHNGKYPLVITGKDHGDETITVPCGNCIGCRLEYSRQWMIRIMNEAQLHQANCFATLTYNDQALPWHDGLEKSDLQKFIKRLRRKLDPLKIRYFATGEYGGDPEDNWYLGRPHYHLAIFGYDFPDKKEWKMREGNQTYLSEELTQLWPQGFHELGSLTHESASYIARYVTKKIRGNKSLHHYQKPDILTGELRRVLPEFSTMSLKPGIGADWFDKYQTDIFPHDEIIVRGKRMTPPRYYLNLYDRKAPEIVEQIKDKRQKAQQLHAWNNTPDRLKIRETVKTAQTKNLTRKLKSTGN